MKTSQNVTSFFMKDFLDSADEEIKNFSEETKKFSNSCPILIKIKKIFLIKCIEFCPKNNLKWAKNAIFARRQV